ncbi:DUF2752 domain-containing protein [Novipirellula artificiosorum]|uniref:DUF2752 domain-containing protein n=1 Tax=Novipirellula artificiosorum TaxID=2528016 RepID=A0A5C6DCH4_9BACT|nr:DUF2752 domain-containing protein [Novipirellula artificiosorum]TWU32926.1 hypothetical protein Poly41_53050 [Novipirellula artificiosorum]
MHDSTRHNPLKTRILAVLVAAMPLSLLITASQLHPDPDGLGTHQQLGFPPCTSRVLFGVRCPSCGMTTSWAYFMHGQWYASASTNLGGFLLAFAAWGTIAVCGVCVAKPQTPLLAHQKTAAWIAIAIAAVTLVDWAVRLFPG